MKQTILTAYAVGKDPIEEVDKGVVAYRKTPHMVTDTNTKLPRFPTVYRGKHHMEARSKDREAKHQMTGPT